VFSLVCICRLLFSTPGSSIIAKMSSPCWKTLIGGNRPRPAVASSSQSLDRRASSSLCSAARHPTRSPARRRESRRSPGMENTAAGRSAPCVASRHLHARAHSRAVGEITRKISLAVCGCKLGRAWVRPCGLSHVPRPPGYAGQAGGSLDVQNGFNELKSPALSADCRRRTNLLRLTKRVSGSSRLRRAANRRRAAMQPAASLLVISPRYPRL